MNPKQERFLQRRIFFTLGLLVIIVTGGTLGYHLIEGWSALDSLYMTIITLTTVGFGELYPLSPAGRAFTMALIVGGLSILGFMSSALVNSLASGELRERFISRRRKRMLEKLHHHDIVCGFGRMGQHVCHELEQQGKRFVVIDSQPEKVAAAAEMGYIALHGDTTSEETLVKAGIHRARSLIAAVDSDAGNVFTVLTARALSADLVIVSRVNQDESIDKLKRAGANEVISPYLLGGRRMVNYVEQPGVVDFLDVVMRSSELELRMEEVAITPDSPLAGKTLGEAALRSTCGVNVLSSHGPDGKLVTNPSSDTRLEVGTHLIVLGTKEQLKKLETITTRVIAQHKIKGNNDDSHR